VFVSSPTSNCFHLQKISRINEAYLSRQLRLIPELEHELALNLESDFYTLFQVVEDFLWDIGLLESLTITQPKAKSIVVILVRMELSM